MDLYSYFNCPWQERRAAIDQIIKDMGSVDGVDKSQRSAAE
jgi:hypothetical protein